MRLSISRDRSRGQAIKGTALASKEIFAVLAGIGFVAGLLAATASPAMAQYYCPPGYYYAPSYGCVANPPPGYAYPPAPPPVVMGPAPPLFGFGLSLGFGGGSGWRGPVRRPVGHPGGGHPGGPPRGGHPGGHHP